MASHRWATELGARVLFGVVVMAAVASTLVVASFAQASTGATVQVSRGYDLAAGDDWSYFPQISADGRYIAYMSDATNLVLGDTNEVSDVFLYDVQNASTILVSANVTIFSGARDPSISADGRYVAYTSEDPNLVPGDTNNGNDVLLYDRLTGSTIRVSVGVNGVEAGPGSHAPSISADGRYVAFYSHANNLVLGDSNFVDPDVFVYDTQTGETKMVSVDSNGEQPDNGGELPSISGDGRYVAFKSSSTNLVPDDTNSHSDIFVHDTATGTTTRVSVATDGTQANGVPDQPAISADGRYVTYHSYATNLVPNDTNNVADVFVYEMATGSTSRVSETASGVGGNNWSLVPGISADGRYVSYVSFATNIVGGDTNGTDDVFVYDRTDNSTSRVSDNFGFVGLIGQPSISTDGRYVTYHAEGSVLVGDQNNGQTQVLLYDSAASSTSTTSTTSTTVGTTTTTTTVSGGDDTFTDDDGSVFEADIEWLAASGITKGCNPPANDMFCPNNTVTRGQMAAFLHRALPDLPVVRRAIDFTDDDDSIFEVDIEWLYSVGVTQGNSATTFNPNGPVTRGQMAAFLVRSLKYTDDGGGDLFVDDDTSQFRGDIDRLGTAGVTKGCNPPTNDKFCPDGFVTRGQMAAFLHRAFGG